MSIFTDLNYRKPQVTIDWALVIAARRADNAKLDPLPALAHQLYLRKQGSGRPYTQPKKPRHEAVVCERCGCGKEVDVLIGRLPVFPAEVTLGCGHRVVLSAGPALVLDAKLFRAESKERARYAIRRRLLPKPGEHVFMERASYLHPEESPNWRPPSPPRPVSAVSAQPPQPDAPGSIFLRQPDSRPTPGVSRASQPDHAQKLAAASPVAISPSPASRADETETPPAEAQANPAAKPQSRPTHTPIPTQERN